LRLCTVRVGIVTDVSVLGSRICWLTLLLVICWMSDFVDRIVQNVLDSSPKTKYIVAVDDSNNTLEEITRVHLTLIQTDFRTFQMILSIIVSLPLPRRIRNRRCLSVCLSVRNFVQKLPN